jgi:monoamine oxidase
VNELVHSFSPDSIRLGCEVRAVDWSRNGGIEVRAVQDTTDLRFCAKRLLITLPHAVLRRSVEKHEGIQFHPPLDAKRDALGQIETGNVIKVVMHFRERFWEDPKIIGKCAPFGFALCLDADFPTWWTQSPISSTLLTGWAGGAQSDHLIGRGAEELESIALTSVSKTFGVSTDVLRRLFVGAFFHDWQRDPFALGAYTYLKVNATNAPGKLAEPIDDTLFFAGEATSSDFNGTVHGAIDSGLRAAREICSR